MSASGPQAALSVLLHVTAHGAYHRGNVGQVLKSIDMVPPRDLYTGLEGYPACP